jgi:DNA-binding CsgD family transcriptional regulator
VATRLHGRDGEVDVLLRFVDAAPSGGTCVAIVEGSSGVGKTAVLEQLAALAQDRGYTILWPGAETLRRPCALPVLHAALDVVVPASASDLDRSRILDRLQEEIERRATNGPLLIALDDLERVDGETLAALRALPMRLRGSPVAWLVSRNVSTHGRLDDELVERLNAEGAIRVELGRLSPDAVISMTADIVGWEPDDDLAAFIRTAGGNASLIVELIEGLCEDGFIDRTGAGRTSLNQLAIPRRVRVLVARRLDRLGHRTRTLLDVLAVFGEPASFEDLAEVLGERVGHIVEPYEEAARHGILMTIDQTVGYRYELERLTVYDMIPGIRRALHAQIGTMFVARGVSAARCAPHLLEGAKVGDGRIVPALDAGTRDLASRAPSAAARLAARALELTAQDDPMRADRVSVAVDAFVTAGRLGEALSLARNNLVRGMPPTHEAQLRCILADALLALGQRDDAIEEAERAHDVGGLWTGSDHDAEILRLRCLLSQERLSEAGVAAVELLSNVPRVGHTAFATALSASSLTSWDAGRFGAALRHAEEAVRRADGGGSNSAAWRYQRSSPIRFRMLLAFQLIALNRLDDADASLDEVRERLEASGDRAWLALLCTQRSRWHLASGRADVAVSEAEHGLDVAQEFELPGPARSARYALADAYRVAGDIEGAAALLRRQHVDGGREEQRFRPFLTVWVRAQLAYAQHGPTRAMSVLEGLYEHVVDHPAPLVEEPAAAWLVRTALAAGDEARAAVVVTAAERLAEGNPRFETVAMEAGHARALLDRDPGRLKETAQDHPRPWVRASAEEDAGRLFAQVGDRAEAVRWLEGALDSYGRIGAGRDVKRVLRRLRQLGVRRTRGRRRERPSSGWASLTDIERHVAELVAHGLTNRKAAEQLFLSPHTVDFHLRQIFRKLDINSRAALGAPYREHEGSDDERQS